MRSEPDTAILLARWQNGENGARDQLVARLHPALVQIAAARLRGERDTSLSTGDLINDAVLQLMEVHPDGLVDRVHLLALASRMMRHILVDHARLKATAKRRHVKVELCTAIDGGQRVELNLLESALIRLKVVDEQLMELVEMRYFGGMTVRDISVVMGLAESTVKRRWEAARAWLTDALENPIEDG